MEEEFDLGNNGYFNDVVASFEEVAADMKTYEFMEDKNKLEQQIYEKYQVDPFDKDSVEDFFRKDFSDPYSILTNSEAIATISHVNKQAGDALQETLGKLDFLPEHKTMIEQTNLFLDIHKQTENLLNPLSEYLNKQKELGE
ncbi:hypothetical protein HOK51_08970 [Candidatus Woesearchaeota archaeon]|nr:hypothetical protein [Candidatus Woesearchaeota archaeon]MBT6519960.1 hypothetical protein [Candidatus Woesearchaeota archaeon]MBT7367839.1 hypothetical protein [Candidatus Woesearchaeota archaeon]